MMGIRVTILSLLLLSVPTSADAHHILGIPHYKYDETYPQIPYMEVLAQVGSHDLVFTHFPGFPAPGERVRFKLYVRDRETGEVFRDPLAVEAVRTRFFRADEPVAPPFVIRPGTGPERNDYKFFLTFADTEAYEIRVGFPLEDGVEVIPFPVVIGATDDRPLLFGAALLLLAAVTSVAIIKKKRHRRGRPPARRRAA